VETRRYVITVRGRLSQRFAASFEGLTLEAGDGITTLNGVFHDQAQLYGVLEHIADYGLELAGLEEQVPGDSRTHRGPEKSQSAPARTPPPSTAINRRN
jgi:hypothetical protein